VPSIAEALRVTSATLDGEAVVCDMNGIADLGAPRFALARQGLREAFLLRVRLELRDEREAWESRCRALVRILAVTNYRVRPSEHMDHDGAPDARAAGCGLTDEPEYPD